MSPATYATVDAVAVDVAAVVTRAIERGGVRGVSYPGPRGNGGAP